MGPLNEIEGKISPFYKPYMDAGANAIPGYQDTLNKLKKSLLKKLVRGTESRFANCDV